MKTIFTAKESANTIKLSSQAIPVQKLSDTPEGYGQLPIDVLENDTEVLIVAPFAGADIEQAEVIIKNDVLTIRGRREMEIDDYGFKRKDYFLQECFWGEFSRSVILPPSADTQTIEATQKNHILYIRIPKRFSLQMRIVKIKTK